MLIYKRKIYGFQCDIYGHLNNSYYLQIYEEARADALTSIGFPVKRLIELGIHIYLVRVEIDFIRGIPLEEDITVRSRIEKMDRLSGLWRQEIFDSRENLCNTALTRGVFVRNGKPARLNKETYTELLNLVK
ncbi:MAG: acyl-CoA thioesterase [Candidatus Cloacimonetes bacterium]|nr:acyl-CoA thioesterase [Candidatus Cloacimonadota bacterium]